MTTFKHLVKNKQNRRLYQELVNQEGDEIFPEPTFEPDKISREWDDWLIPLLIKDTLTPTEFVCILLGIDPKTKDGQFISDSVVYHESNDFDSTKPLERKTRFLARIIEEKIYKDTRAICKKRGIHFNPAQQTFWCLNNCVENNPLSEHSALQQPFSTAAFIQLEKDIAKRVGIKYLTLPLHEVFTQYNPREPVLEHPQDILDCDTSLSDWMICGNIEPKGQNIQEEQNPPKKRGRPDAFGNEDGIEKFSFVYALWIRNKDVLTKSELHAKIGKMVQDRYPNKNISKEGTSIEDLGERLVEKMDEIVKRYSLQGKLNFHRKK